MADDRARELRKFSTEAEARLWAALRSRRLGGVKFRRQFPLGSFIADFASTRHRLVIEADGGQHADSEADRQRTRWLEAHGWRVLRFWNNDILANLDGVLATILMTLDAEEPLARTAGEGGAREAGG
jgi:very-short-patch-repair endonuclease